MRALQTFAVLQEWGSFGWSVSFIQNCSPHILPRVHFCIICDAICRPNSVPLHSAPLVCSERLSTSRNIVDWHGKAVLCGHNSSLSFPDVATWFRRRRSCHLCASRSNLLLQVGDVIAIDNVADRGCLLFGTRKSPTRGPRILVHGTLSIASPSSQ